MTEEKIELSAPPDVERQGGTEILRLFISDGALSLSMQRAFEQPAMWGQLIAELAQQISEVYARETDLSASEALADIRAAQEAAFERIESGVGPAVN
jgi:hypothetical protein